MRAGAWAQAKVRAGWFGLVCRRVSDVENLQLVFWTNLSVCLPDKSVFLISSLHKDTIVGTYLPLLPSSRSPNQGSHARSHIFPHLPGKAHAEGNTFDRDRRGTWRHYGSQSMPRRCTGMCRRPFALSQQFHREYSGTLFPMMHSFFIHSAIFVMCMLD